MPKTIRLALVGYSPRWCGCLGPNRLQLEADWGLATYGTAIVTELGSRDRRGDGLAQLLEDRAATVAVVGMGYVGVPLACAFVEQGIRTIGFDTNSTRVGDLESGRPYIGHLDESVFRRLAANEDFIATTQPQALGKADAVVICVPTPLDEKNVPDLSPVTKAAEDIAEHGRPGQLVVLESTTYPGTTRDVLVPALSGAEAGWTPQEDGLGFFIAYSPERIDPGGSSDFTATPKLVAGLDDESARLAAALYGSVFADVRLVNDIETAEAAKLLENTFRAANIALVNELKVAFTSLGIDIWEVIDAAASKPFGYMPFYPGPGVGGHCIPIDPEYLAWKTRDCESPLALTEAAIRINREMPRYIVDRVGLSLEARGSALAGSSILIVGVAYKPGVSDVRRSPALPLLEELVSRGASVAYHDPFVPTLDTVGLNGRERLDSVAWNADCLAGFDAAIICTDHDSIDYAGLASSGILTVDTRNAMARRGFVDPEKIVKA